MTPEIKMGEGEKFQVPGCPVADGKAGCVVTCAGRWPGTNVTTEGMTKAVVSGKVIPERFGCGQLEANARYGLAKLKEQGKNGSLT